MRFLQSRVLFGGLAVLLAVLACNIGFKATPNVPASMDASTPTVPAPMETATPVTQNVDTPLPTSTPISTATLAPTLAPVVAFDQNVDAYRVRFAPNGTWVEINDTISMNVSKRYAFSAMQGQIMSISIPQGSAFSVNVAGVDEKLLSDSLHPQPFWRGVLPSTQDYIVTVESQMSGPFSLRVAINPPGQATQIFGFVDTQYAVAISYTDEFAPTDVQAPVNTKGTPLLTLAFIDPAFYSPRTNLSEATLVLAASADPAVVSTCIQPSSEFGETVTGQASVKSHNFTRSEFSGAAAGNRYDQVAYRTVWNNKCFELVFLIHSTNIGNYTPGTVVEYDRTILLSKFEAILNTFLAN